MGRGRQFYNSDLAINENITGSEAFRKVPFKAVIRVYDKIGEGVDHVKMIQEKSCFVDLRSKIEEKYSELIAKYKGTGYIIEHIILKDFKENGEIKKSDVC